jgi:hypothetical protein
MLLAVAVIIGTIWFHDLLKVNYLVACGGAIGILMFFPLCEQIWKKTIVQNPLTFLLWSTLDAISAWATKDGNYLQAMLYAIGGFLVVACILYAGRSSVQWGKQWEPFHTKVSLLVVACLVVWYFTDETYAALATACALAIAGLPQVRDTWREPSKTPADIYMGYMLGAFLAILGGKGFSIIESGYSVSSLIICSAIVICTRHKVAVV